MQIRLLVVSEDVAMRRLLRALLRTHGYHVLHAVTADEALARLVSENPSAILLDLGRPQPDGLQTLRRLRQHSPAPVVVLSSRQDEAVKVAALDLGADDYVTTPFGPAELLARIQAALRHGLQQQGIAPLFHAAALRVDLARRVVTLDGRPVELTGKEYALLEALVRSAGRVVPHDALLRTVWGPAHTDDVQYLRSCVQALRRKLEPDPDRPAYLLTEPRIGYRLRPPG